MRAGAHVSAAMEVLAALDTPPRPAGDALKEWGVAHRFAGSGDRAAIAGLVYDALRRRASSAWIMGANSPRAVLLGTLRLARGLDAVLGVSTGQHFVTVALKELGQDRGVGRRVLDQQDLCHVYLFPPVRC